MKILFYGDSITDMGRNREYTNGEIYSYGSGYPMFVASKLFSVDPKKHEIINMGISGNRIVDLYARIKADVWNRKPDLVSILIGINDIWHEINWKNGVDPERFERVYSMLVEDTEKVLPATKFILMEPFVLRGTATESRFGEFESVYEYAKIVKRIAEKYGLYFLPLQKKFDDAAEKFGPEPYLPDGVHPNVAGATLIADAWVALFEEKFGK